MRSLDEFNDGRKELGISPIVGPKTGKVKLARHLGMTIKQLDDFGQVLLVISAKSMS